MTFDDEASIRREVAVAAARISVETPDDLLTSISTRWEGRRRRVRVVVGAAAVLTVLFAGLAASAIGNSKPPESDAPVVDDDELPSPQTLVPPEGEVPANVCPAARHPSGSAGPDALPPNGSTTIESVQLAVSDLMQGEIPFSGITARAVPRNGFVWKQSAGSDSGYSVSRTTDWQIQVQLESVDDCPTGANFIGTATGRIPVTFTIYPGATGDGIDSQSVEVVASGEFATGKTWKLVTYQTDRGRCVDVVLATGGGGGCPSDVESLNIGYRAVRGVGQLYSAVGKPEVDRLEFDLDDGRVVEADAFDSEHGLRYFILEVPYGQMAMSAAAFDDLGRRVPFERGVISPRP